jgi:hypothetical protein
MKCDRNHIVDLIENCEAVNIIINKSEIALFLTCKHCYSMMVEALVLKCDDVNIADNSNIIPLLVAS